MSLCNESEARELWCPMVRIARIETVSEMDVIVGGCNADALGRIRVPASCRCVASKCAMWRWNDADHVNANRRLGFCGLAGKAVH